MSEENYLHGILNGDVIYYYDNGIASEKYVYLNGLKNGQASIFYQSGFINGNYNYLKNQLHGQAKFYYNNELMQLESEGNYYYGAKDSTWIFYHETGDVVKIEKYHRGNIINE